MLIYSCIDTHIYHTIIGGRPVHAARNFKNDVL